MAVTEVDREYLARCVELARAALDNGDEPFGSVLVSPDGTVLVEDRNRTGGGDPTQHPEILLAYWALANLDESARSASTVYTSGEHCPMCSSAHAWVGLGRIVFATSSAQITAWRGEWGSAASPVAALPITTVAPGIPVDGPAPEFEPVMRDLYRTAYA